MTFTKIPEQILCSKIRKWKESYLEDQECTNPYIELSIGGGRVSRYPEISSPANIDTSKNGPETKVQSPICQELVKLLTYKKSAQFQDWQSRYTLSGA